MAACSGVQAQIGETWTYQRWLSQTTPYLPFPETHESNYNLKWGRLTGRFDASIQFEANDNINLADSDRQGDVAMAPQLGVGFLWPLSDLNILQFDVGVGYRAYLDHSELSSLYVTPGTHLNYRLIIENVQIALQDDLYLQIDPTSRPELSGLGTETLDFRVLQNASGLNARWQPAKDWTVSAAYAYQIYHSLTGDYEFLSHDRHNFSTGVTTDLSPRWTVGWSGAYSMFYYVKEVQNDGTSYETGPMAVFKPSQFFTIDVGCSYSEMLFDQTGTVNDRSDFGGLTFRAQIHHTLNSRTTHSLQVRRGADLGFGSNFSEILALQYGLDRRLTSVVNVHASVVYEHLDTSGSLGEQADRYLVHLGGHLRLAPRWRLGLAYTFGWRDSDQSGRDYLQNRLTLDLTRRF